MAIDHDKREELLSKIRVLEAAQTFARQSVRLALKAHDVKQIQDLSLEIRNRRRAEGGLRELNESLWNLYYLA